MKDVASVAKAIREAGLPAWLLSNQFHRDEIADLVLGVPASEVNTRPWVCLIRANGEVAKIVHRIEARTLDHLPGASEQYVSREEFKRALSSLLPRGSRVAAQFSTSFPVSSFLDHGTALLLEDLGVELVSSDDLVVDCLGTMSAEESASHERAAAGLQQAVQDAWERVRLAAGTGEVVREGDVRDWIVRLLKQKGLESDAPPIVAAGAGSADPHYWPEGPGRELEPGSVVQLDLWAKEPGPTAVYADIAWVGVMEREATPEQRRLFDAVVEAREYAIAFIEDRLASGAAVRGSDVDEAVRDHLGSRGLAFALRHRTGHAIGGRVHGFGVNLDSVEFPDNRTLRDGSCFSIEPGLYLERFGMRSEVDGYIRDGHLAISGGQRQECLLQLR